MSSSDIDIKIIDKIAPSISTNLQSIEKSSLLAADAIDDLKKSLSGIKTRELSKLANSYSKISKAKTVEIRASAALANANSKLQQTTNAQSLAQQKLKTEVERTSLAKNKASTQAAKTKSALSKISSDQAKDANARWGQVEAINAKRRLADAKEIEAARKGRIAVEKAEQGKIAAYAATEARKTKVANAEVRTSSRETQRGAAQHLINEQKLAQAKQKTAVETSRASTAHSNSVSAMRRADTAAVRLANTQKKLSTNTKRTSSNVGGLVRQLAVFAGISFSAAGIIGAADSYTLLQNKLKNVIDSETQLIAVTREVTRTALAARTPIADVGKAFQRFDLAMMQLGASQKESLRLTETVSKALTLGGATALESASGLLQLSQAFNKTKLDGDEFRTLMEIMPSLADAIAKQLKVTRGELLKLAPTGVITSSVMRKAFAAAADLIDKKFATTTVTMGQAFTNLHTRLVVYWGDLNSSIGFTNVLASGVLILSENLRIAGIVAAGLATRMLVAFGPAMIGGIKKVTFAVLGMNSAMASNPMGLLIVGLATATAALISFRDEIFLMKSESVTLGDAFASAFGFISDVASEASYFVGNVWEEAFGRSDEASKKATDKLIADQEGVVSVTKNLANKFIRVVNSVFNGLLQSAKSFFPALMDNLRSGYNAMIDGLEVTDNFILKKLGFDPVSMESYKAELSGGGADFAKSFMIGFDGEWSKNSNYIDDFSNALDSDLKRISAKRTATSKGKLRGETEPPAPAQTPSKRSDFLEKINTELAQEYRLLQLLGPERELQQRYDQIENKFSQAKIKLDPALAQGLSKKIVTLQKESKIQGALNNIYNETKGALADNETAIIASKRAYDQKIISLETYRRKLIDINAESARLKLAAGTGSFGDVATGSLTTMLDGYVNVLSGLETSFGSFFSSVSAGFADSIGNAIVYSENLGEALSNVAKGAMSELISGIVQIGVQYVLSSVMGNAAMATTTATNLASAAAMAAAWTPAATFVSLASFGANSVPAMAGIAATSAMSTALSVVPGFQSGGYTGDKKEDEISGFVHGREFVVNAQATKRNRSALEDMNKGRAVGKEKGSSNVNLNVVVENHTSAEITIERLTPTDVRIIAKEVVRQETPNLVASEIQNPSSRVSRALGQNTMTQRKR